ncbi:rod shape-determining protein RodA [Cyanobacterium aponinum UTEX 3222]|uniref:Peptidoglycan glycosyltransferase RodA n=3 Tax=Cyanobacterium aponinum TaxID=379064 RepID=K9Z690_CYAAP|nr:rod shape-determining protein RodA [Cyanobacterium aponinum]WRL43324.1 rod shape-determining protein RodA [Cyanobacterium aponinum UTEX 3222]AFZ54686.1 rod shape-determining protein RodA [Cyanobacterium aponinum PCC 10605]MTF38356.1 rod shape-determining protein RodA [Cyanobacterium aponinum 0216]WPF87929.1 rod shape-determining protein RodA [Cyanobacterium aponinum AL20115]WRL36992.1 rod shape-determining protein RodA [Cyanobacterium aponinum UTEX 3221]
MNHTNRSLDWFLITLVVGISGFGSLIIYTTQLYKQGSDWQQQLIMVVIGSAILLGLSYFPYELLLKFHWFTYGFTNLLLVAVIFFGTTINGAQSWIYIGSFNFQPSEFAKIGLIITLAALLHFRDASRVSRLFPIASTVALPWLLIMAQPDLGTGLVFGAITFTMLYWANANLGWILLILSPLVSAFLFNLFLPAWLIFTVVMIIIAWFTLPRGAIWALITLTVNYMAGILGHILWDLLKPYQKDRLTLFLDPEKDPLGGGYHLIQSRIAIGSGELWGNGLFEGTQTHLNFVPEQHTDFIFSAIGDQLGFVGAIATLIVYWFICLRLVIIANRARDDFGSLIAIGVLGMIAFQTIINIGMTIGLAPITGIPLPLLSYGRSSLLSNFIAFGIVEAIAANIPKKNTSFR